MDGSAARRADRGAGQGIERHHAGRQVAVELYPGPKRRASAAENLDDVIVVDPQNQRVRGVQGADLAPAEAPGAVQIAVGRGDGEMDPGATERMAAAVGRGAIDAKIPAQHENADRSWKLVFR